MSASHSHHSHSNPSSNPSSSSTNQTPIDITKKNALYHILDIDPHSLNSPNTQSNTQSNTTQNESNTQNNTFKTLLKKKYRRAAMKHHPDSGGLEQNFSSLGLAYEILNDENKKEWYDDMRGGVFDEKEYAQFLEIGRFAEHFNEKAFRAMVEEVNYVENSVVNKMLNVGRKLAQLVGLLGFVLGFVVYEAFWNSEQRRVHWVLSAACAVGAYLYWGRWLCCWCLWCWCWSPLMAALVVPILFSLRARIWSDLIVREITTLLENWKLTSLIIGALELVLHFVWGHSWTSALFYAVLLYLMRPVLVLLMLSGTLVAHLLQIRALYLAIFSAVVFVLDVFWLHWLPVGYTKKFLMIIWTVILILASPGKDGVQFDDEEKEEEEVAHESVTPTFNQDMKDNDEPLAAGYVSDEHEFNQ